MLKTHGLYRCSLQVLASNGNGWPSRPEASPDLRGVLDAYVDAARAPNHAVREAVAKTRRMRT